MYVFPPNYAKGVDLMWSQMAMHTCTDACTHYPRNGTEGGVLGHASGATLECTCMHVTMQKCGADMGNQVNMNSCTDACTFNEVWDQRGLTDIHMWDCTSSCATIQRNRGSMRCQLNMHMHTDPSSHSNQGVGPDEELLGHAHRAKQGCTCFCTTYTICKGFVGGVGSQMDLYSCTDAYTHSNQCLRPDV